MDLWRKRFYSTAKPSESNAVKKLSLLAIFLEITKPFAFRRPAYRPWQFRKICLCIVCNSLKANSPRLKKKTVKYCCSNMNNYFIMIAVTLVEWPLVLTFGSQVPLIFQTGTPIHTTAAVGWEIKLPSQVIYSSVQCTMQILTLCQCI